MMKWYYPVFPIQEDIPRSVLRTDTDELNGVDFIDDLMSAIPVSDWNPKSWIRSTSPRHDGSPGDFLACHLGLPVISSRLRIALEKQGVGRGDVQILPVNVYSSSGDQFDGYSIFNVISAVRALDRAQSGLIEHHRSRIDQGTNQREITALARPALFLGPLEGHDIVRLAEYLSVMVVSERFAEVFTDGEFTGMRLGKPLTVSP